MRAGHKLQYNERFSNVNTRTREQAAGRFSESWLHAHHRRFFKVLTPTPGRTHTFKIFILTPGDTLTS
jgi:sarcosine oxidase delta subunit